MTRRALGIASAAYPLGVAVFAAFAVWTSASEHFEHLFADDWVILAQRGEQSFARWLIASHNGHLIPLTRLLLHADLEWLAGRGTLPTAVGLLATGAAAALLWLTLRASGIERASLRWTVGAFLALCLIYGGLVYGLLWGFAAHAPVMAAWLALSIGALIAWAVEDPPRPRVWLVWLAFVGAFGASLACATGVGAWAALLAIAIAARLPLRVHAAIVVSALVCALLLAAALQREPAADLLSPWLGHPVVFARFLLRYLGTPLAWPAESWLGVSEAARTNVAFAAGAIGMAGYLAHLAQRIRAGRMAETAGLLGIALMTFGVAAAAATAIGRAGAFQPVNHRFTPFALLFWMGGAVALAAPAGASRWRACVQHALLLVLPVASLLLLHSLGPRLDHHRERRVKIARYTLMLVVGIRGDGIAYALSNGKRATDVLASLPGLEARGHGPFRDPRRTLLGGPVAAAGIAGEPSPCEGEIRQRRKLSGRQGRGEEVEGVLDAAPGRTLPTSLVIADAKGVIRGLGDVLAPQAAQAEWYAVSSARLDRRSRVYAVFENGSACEFEVPPR